jgi:hypothetical protein
VIDLDAVERRAKYFENGEQGYDPNVPALVAELRAARKVVEVGRAIVAPTIPHEQRWTALRRALADYDKQTEVTS